jgi:hypothetical protein
MVSRIDRLARSIGDLQDIVRAVRPADAPRCWPRWFRGSLSRDQERTATLRSPAAPALPTISPLPP